MGRSLFDDVKDHAEGALANDPDEFIVISKLCAVLLLLAVQEQGLYARPLLQPK